MIICLPHTPNARRRLCGQRKRSLPHNPRAASSFIHRTLAKQLMRPHMDICGRMTSRLGFPSKITGRETLKEPLPSRPPLTHFFARSLSSHHVLQGAYAGHPPLHVFRAPVYQDSSWHDECIRKRLPENSPRVRSISFLIFGIPMPQNVRFCCPVPTMCLGRSRLNPATDCFAQVSTRRFHPQPHCPGDSHFVLQAYASPSQPSSCSSIALTLV